MLRYPYAKCGGFVVSVILLSISNKNISTCDFIKYTKQK